MNQIHLDSPNVGELEKKYLNNCIDSTFVSTFGPFISEFENKFKNYLNIKNAVSIQSGTAAIYMSLYELGLKPGDEVILPVLTFIATATPIIHLGATPVFVDVDPETWNIDPNKIEEKITKNTKAIIPVHLYGNPSNMKKIMEISKKYNVPIIEDATECLGAIYDNKLTGTFGKLGAFSFNGNKIITTGGGGMLVSEDTEKIEHIRFLINQAKYPKKEYHHPEIGFNYRMTNLEASMGLAQFERLPEFLNKKRKFAEIYKTEFENNSNIKIQKEQENSQSSWWLPSITIKSKKTIPEIQQQLKEKGIPTRRIFIPITEFPPFKKYKKEDYSNAYYIYENGLNLPGSTLNTEELIEYVAKEINNVI